jgi:hypothetical protein
MNLSLWDTPSEYFQLEHPRRPFPVMPSLTVLAMHLMSKIEQKFRDF